MTLNSTGLIRFSEEDGVMLKRIWRDDEGFLTFEWILLLTLLIIGIVAAVSAVRDAISAQAIGVAGAVESVDTSYFIPSPIQGGVGITTFCPNTIFCGFGGGWARPTRDLSRRSGRIAPTALPPCRRPAARNPSVRYRGNGGHRAATGRRAGG